jgi:dihydropteroate synthase
MSRTFAGLSLERPLVMGIVNVTPDSFSDGGDHLAPERAVERGLEMRSAGADILDVGGESTRPGAAPVEIAEELERVLPVVEGLAKAGACVSIDTRHAEVMRQAAGVGAAIINDVTALTGEPGALDAAAALGLPVVLMHMQGEPQTMQANPQYVDVVEEVLAYLKERVAACEAAGIAGDKIAVDPGIGFGKTLEHNLALIRHLDRLGETGCPVLLGASRKSFIGKLGGGAAPKDRLGGSVAAALEGARRGADILRVHDVAETVQALALWRAMEESA